MQRAWYIAIFLLILTLPAAHAAFSIAVNPMDNSILRNESASYQVTINNFGKDAGNFQVYTVDPSWNIRTEPLDLSVDPSSSKSFTLYLRPTTEAGGGAQGINVNFKDLASGIVIPKTIVVSLGNGIASDYAATIALDITMPYEIDPRNPVPLRIDLRNRNPLNISGLLILISSPHFNTSTTVNLGPLSEKTKDIEGITVDPYSSPGEAEVSVQVIYQGHVINQLVKNYRIKEYTQVQQNVNEDSFFFKTEKTITITNNGNAKNNAIVSIPTSLLKNMFVSASLPYESKVQDNARVLVWNIPLGPQEQKTFIYTENYRVLVLLIIIAILGGIAYLFLRSPLVAIKEAVAVAHPDGVSDIKVRVFVRNRSAKLIQGIQITDRVPPLADVIKQESPGSISPSKIAASEKHGTLLRWDLEVLEPFEERVLTYKVKSKLKVIGRMKLPNAKVRYVHDGKERMVFSNNIELVERFRDK